MAAGKGSFHIKLPIRAKKKDGRFVAGSPVLDVWPQGEDRGQAIQCAGSDRPVSGILL